jgi:hypothetical protein
MPNTDRSDIEKEYDEAYSHAWHAFGPWQSDAKKDIQAALGDIWTAEERQKLKLRGSDVLSIPLIRPIVKWVAGFQADHRKGIKYDPIEGGDVATAHDFTEVNTGVIQRNKGYNVISKAFEHALNTGLCLVDVFNNLNSDTCLDHYFYNQFLLDPSWTKLDLSDCNYMMMRKFVTKEQAKILLPEDFSRDINKVDDDKVQSDGKFTNLTAPVQFGHKMFSYDQFQQRTTKEEIIIILRQSGKQVPWKRTKAELDEFIPALIQATGMPPESISTITRTVPTIKVSSFLNSKHVQTEIDPFGIGDYSATPIQCFYTPEYDRMEWKLQGMVRSLKDIQRAETKRILASVAWFENSAGNGLDFEENTLVDEEDAFKTGIGPRKFQEGKLDGARDRVTPPLPGGMLELHSILTDLMPKTVNVNPDMMGLPPDAGAAQISGLLSELRIGSGMVGLRGLFDDLSQSQNIIGSKLLKLYQQYPMEKITRILGREPSQGFREAKTAKFDAATSEAPLTNTQINTQYQEAINLKRLGKELGDPFPMTWVEILQLGSLQIGQKQLENIKQREQAQTQQRQRAAQSQQQVQDITIEVLKSQAMQAQAKAAETPSNVAKNMTTAELNKAKAVQSITAAELNEAKSSGAEVDIQTSVLNSAIEISKLGIEQQKLNQPVPSGGQK